LFFGDSYSWWIWAAMVLMFIGLFCVNVIGVYKPRAIAAARM
jgi:drug/metabolite transporter (DMT)-like permease